MVLRRLGVEHELLPVRFLGDVPSVERLVPDTSSTVWSEGSMVEGASINKAFDLYPEHAYS